MSRSPIVRRTGGFESLAVHLRSGAKTLRLIQTKGEKKMYLNDFSVRIPESNEAPGGYVEMRHGQTYTLKLRNSRNVRCDARVEIDGKHVGTWRVRTNSGITLERPAHDTGQFTFYKLGTPEASAAQLNGGDPNLGLVRVTFMPERERVYPTAWPKPWEPWPRPPWQPWPIPYRHQYDWSASTKSLAEMPMAGNYQSRSAGGTGLSGASGQQFVDAGHIDYDYSQQTVIHLRLVCKDDHGPRPLTSTSNPVPPRVW